MTGRALDGERLLARLPEVRGRLTRMRALADLTWFRVGGWQLDDLDQQVVGRQPA